jgi:uncharacterized protein YecE (DUF72 family)
MIQTPPIVTSDFVYLRLIGDRSISEKDFGTILKDRAAEMSRWANKLKEVQEHKHDVKTAMVAANNHYAGYAPETSNLFREMMGFNRVSWGDEKEIPRKVEFEQVRDQRLRPVKQTSLSDFIPK